jgi:hypothetical protein
MAKYRRYDYSQCVLIPVSREGQLMPGTSEFAIHALAETRIDTSILRLGVCRRTPRNFIDFVHCYLKIENGWLWN